MEKRCFWKVWFFLVVVKCHWKTPWDENFSHWFYIFWPLFHWFEGQGLANQNLLVRKSSPKRLPSSHRPCSKFPLSQVMLTENDPSNHVLPRVIHQQGPGNFFHFQPSENGRLCVCKEKQAKQSYGFLFSLLKLPREKIVLLLSLLACFNMWPWKFMHVTWI